LILVFGKTGQVAIELQRLGGVMALGREDVDLVNPAACVDAIKFHRPEAVINAAAYTAVDNAENEESLATIINGDAPTAMAHACAKLKTPFVHISTDYVFDGSGETPWMTSHIVAPQNAYGRSKLKGEIGVQNSGAVYAILRTSWIFSIHGTNFVNTMLRLSETHNELDVVADQVGGPTFARDIAEACIKIANCLIQDPLKSGTYHYSGAPDVSWADFANEIFLELGRVVTINPIKSSEYFMSAKRPMNSRFDCSKIEKIFSIQRPDWRKGLKMISKEIGNTR